MRCWIAARCNLIVLADKPSLYRIAVNVDRVNSEAGNGFKAAAAQKSIKCFLPDWYALRMDHASLTINSY